MAYSLVLLFLIAQSFRSHSVFLQEHQIQRYKQAELITDQSQFSETDNPFCSKWVDEQCVQCAPRSYFNQKRICLEVDPLCSQFNQNDKKCASCYKGYDLSKGKCVLKNINEIDQNWIKQNPFCSDWKNKSCQHCSPRSYMNKQKICIKVDDSCQTYSSLNGSCLSCYDGYELNQEIQKCILQQNAYRSKNPFCSKWIKKVCIQCSLRSFKNRQGLCEQVDVNCNSYSQQTGQCLTCYKGNELRNKKCIQLEDNNHLANPYCIRWSGKDCIRCAGRTFNKSGVCTPINSLCHTFQYLEGNCTSCYLGYSLAEGNCIHDLNTRHIEENPLCNQWSNIKCIKCSKRSYFNQKGLCTSVSQYCNSYSQENGSCLSCYSGYKLQSGRCLIEQQQDYQEIVSKNPLCNTWKGKKCVKCSFRSYFNENEICSQIDPYCKRFSEQKRICTKCYQGYKLNRDLKGCSLPNAKIIQMLKSQLAKEYDDPYCKIWQNPFQCNSCASGTYMGSNNKCIVFSENCKIFNHSQKICEDCSNNLFPFEDKCLEFTNSKNFEIESCLKWRQSMCIQCPSKSSANQNQLCRCT